jgi:aminoglycoside phosphotransferase (APT) family kinase protein
VLWAGGPRSVTPVTDASVDESIVEWALAAVGGDHLVSITGLGSGGPPWLLRYEGSGGVGSAVLRVGTPWTAGTLQFEVRGIALARAAGVPAPDVIAARADDKAALLLIDYVDGSSRQSAEPDPARLEALGRMAARISMVDLGDAELPAVTHPIPGIDFDQLRARAQPQPLLAAAQQRVAAVVPDDPVGFVHGDLWSGNILWRGAELTAVIDWDCPGRGAAGVDLGSLRCDAAMCYGLEAADHVLAGWQREAEQSASSLDYWDAVAALSTPPDIDWFAEAITRMTGRPDLTKQRAYAATPSSPTHSSVCTDSTLKRPASGLARPRRTANTCCRLMRGSPGPGGSEWPDLYVWRSLRCCLDDCKWCAGRAYLDAGESRSCEEFTPFGFGAFLAAHHGEHVQVGDLG